MQLQPRQALEQPRHALRGGAARRARPRPAAAQRVQRRLHQPPRASRVAQALAQRRARGHDRRPLGQARGGRAALQRVQRLRAAAAVSC